VDLPEQQIVPDHLVRKRRNFAQTLEQRQERLTHGSLQQVHALGRPKIEREDIEKDTEKGHDHQGAAQTAQPIRHNWKASMRVGHWILGKHLLENSYFLESLPGPENYSGKGIFYQHYG